MTSAVARRLASLSPLPLSLVLVLASMVMPSLVLTELTLGAPSAQAQAKATATMGPPLSRFDLFGGYAYWRPVNSDINGAIYTPITLGSVASVTGWITPHFGIQAEANIMPEAQDDQNCNYTAQAGPIYRVERGRFVPFVHALGGGAEVGGPVNQKCGVWGYGITAGIGVDYLLPVLNGHLSIRPAQLDFSYAHIDNGFSSDPTFGGVGDITAVRYTGGIVFHLGTIGEPGRIDTALSCAADPAEIFAGDPVVLTATAANLHSKKALRYLWSSTGGKITGSEATAQLDSTDLAPGEYTVAAHMVEADRARELAACTTTFVVTKPLPPTVSCTADKAAINSGDTVLITTVASSPQGRRLTYTYTTSNGIIAGSGPTATLTTTGATPGTISVTCQVADDKGMSATTHTSVVVATPKVVQPAPMAEARCKLTFDRDRRRPTRVDNESKACLDDLALQLNRDTAAQLLLNGTYTQAETKNTAGERALNAAEYLEKERGIDQQRLVLRISPSDQRAVNSAIIPQGAQLDADPAAAGGSVFDATTVERHGQAYGTTQKAGTEVVHHGHRRHHRRALPAGIIPAQQ